MRAEKKHSSHFSSESPITKHRPSSCDIITSSHLYSQSNAFYWHNSSSTSGSLPVTSDGLMVFWRHGTVAFTPQSCTSIEAVFKSFKGLAFSLLTTASALIYSLQYLVLKFVLPSRAMSPELSPLTLVSLLIHSLYDYQRTCFSCPPLLWPTHNISNSA